MTTYYWVLENLYNGFSRNELEHEIQKAFDKWSRYILADFKKINIKNYTPNEDIITIGFYSGKHNCLSFDGKHGVLAHASYSPFSMKSLSVHFDADENWNITGDLNSIFFKDPFFHNIAVHEIGHILGLNHNTDRRSIMFKKYSRFISDLSNNDILNLQKIHGTRLNIENRAEEPYLFILIKVYYKEITCVLLTYIIFNYLFQN